MQKWQIGRLLLDSLPVAAVVDRATVLAMAPAAPLWGRRWAQAAREEYRDFLSGLGLVALCRDEDHFRALWPHRPVPAEALARASRRAERVIAG